MEILQKSLQKNMHIETHFETTRQSIEELAATQPQRIEEVALILNDFLRLAPEIEALLLWVKEDLVSHQSLITMVWSALNHLEEVIETTELSGFEIVPEVSMQLQDEMVTLYLILKEIDVLLMPEVKPTRANAMWQRVKKILIPFDTIAPYET